MNNEQSQSISEKLNEIIAAMKETGIWLKAEPEWVKHFNSELAVNHPNFYEWLQFVYLPNCMHNNELTNISIVPQAIKYFSNDIKKGKLLRLLIELDALL